MESNLVFVGLDEPLETRGGIEGRTGTVAVAMEESDKGFAIILVSSFARHTGTKFVLISTAVCRIGLDICRLRKLPLSGSLGGPSKLLRDDVGDKLLVSSAEFLSILCLSAVGVRLTSFDLSLENCPIPPFSVPLSESGDANIGSFGADKMLSPLLLAGTRFLSLMLHTTALFADTSFGSTFHVGVKSTVVVWGKMVVEPFFLSLCSATDVGTTVFDNGG